VKNKGGVKRAHSKSIRNYSG